MSFPLMMRPYQVRTIEDSWEKFRGGCKSLLLCSPTGSGKTVMGCKIIDDVVGAGRKVLFLAHRKELITQCSKKLDFCQVPHGVVMAGFKMDSTAPVQVASKDSWNRRNLPFIPDLIITDECFVAGTMVDGRPIETITAGDRITAFDEETGRVVRGDVVRVFKNRVPTELIRIRLSGIETVCTRNHPFLTQDGWRLADCLNKGDLIYAMSNLRRGDSQKKRHSVSSLLSKRNVRTKQAGFSKANEGKQSHGEGGDSREDVRNAQKNRAQTSYPRRKRTLNGSSNQTCRSPGMADGSCSSNRVWPREDFPLSLQAGYCQRRGKNSDRSRRGLSLYAQKQTNRPEKRNVPHVDRVEAVEILKQGSDGEFERVCPDGFVYNVEVGRYHTYVANGLVVHNCHHSAADSYKKIYQAYPNALHLGLTATPFRADGIGLGDVFQDWVLSASIQELITQGYLAPPRYWAPDTPDLKGIGKRGNDFNPEEVAERMKKSHITGNVVKHYCAHALGKRGIYFAVNKQHSQEMTEAFIAAGIGAAHLDDSTGSREREQILGAHMAGEILIICNVNILSEGYDSPGVEVVGQVRPTLSKGLHLQQLGRGLRIHPGKETAIILDHAGNVRRHGFAEDEIEVDLSHGLRSRKSDDQEKAPALRTCKKCYAVLPASVEECPSCGSVLGQPPLTIVEKDGSLKEITRPACPCGSMETVKKAHPGNGSGIFCKKCGQLIKWISKQAAPADFLKEKIKLGKMKGYKESWAFIQFKIRFGNWPSSKEREEAEAA